MLIDERHIRNYIKLCKLDNFELIRSISNDINNMESYSNIAIKYNISIDEIEAVHQIMKNEYLLNCDDGLKHIYVKYHLMKGGGLSVDGLSSLAKSFSSGNLSGIASSISKQMESISKTLEKELDKNISGLTKQFKGIIHELKEDIIKEIRSACKHKQSGGSIETVCKCCKCSRDEYVFTDDNSNKCM